MQVVETRYGRIPVDGPVERLPDGQVASCTPVGGVELSTGLGPLTPQFSTDDLRRRTVQALSFHKNGRLRSLPLEAPTVVGTPVGETPAELVTFHANGSVHRVFPLNGRLSGFWSQEDEEKLAEPVRAATSFGPVEAKFICLAFYPDGKLKSLTLWPGETISVPTPLGVIPTRTGVRFSPTGAVLSVEPASPTPVSTPIGAVRAYDPDVVGVTGDENSLGFDEEGGLLRLTTTLTRVRAVRDDGEAVYAPAWRESLCGDTDREVVPMRLSFARDGVSFQTDPKKAPVRVEYAGTTFTTEPHLREFELGMERFHCSM